MSGRTLQVGQVWEHWGERHRIRIKEIGVNWVRTDQVTTGGTFVQNLVLLHETVLGQFVYIGELEP